MKKKEWWAWVATTTLAGIGQTRESRDVATRFLHGAVSRWSWQLYTDINQVILYTIDVNCSEKSFRDVAVGAKEFNEFENQDSECKDPKGDTLILGAMDQVCGFIN